MKKVVVGTFVVGLAFAAFVLPMWLVPYDVRTPYLLRPKFRFDAGWEMGEVQPVFLYSFTRGSDRYLKGAIRDIAGNIKLVSVWVGGELDGTKVPPAPFIRTDKENKKNAEVEGFVYPLRFGQRFRVLYMASHEPEDQEIKDEVCTQSFRVCLITEAMVSDMQRSLVFRETGYVKGLDRIYALGIYPQTVGQYLVDKVYGENTN